MRFGSLTCAGYKDAAGRLRFLAADWRNGLDLPIEGSADVWSSADSAAHRQSCAGEPVDGRKDNIHVSDPDVQVRRMRHAEILCEPLGDVVREKWKSRDSAEVG